ncbi:hypothetical protein [Porticoccus sp. Uisw_050_02]|uniref:hypothetical protein n=1 Tax=Porticoccus sp. Uisw_050_02 TaxID=3230978 RepID=UPI0039E9BC94
MTDTQNTNQENRTQRPIISLDNDASAEKVLKEVYFDPNETKDKLRRYFLIIFAVGLLVILLPLPSFLDGSSGYMRIGASCLLMATYYLLGAKYTKSSNTRAVFADSLYYLGFLFTFAALVGAMVQLNDLNIQVIIGKMGPALVTTVIGMAARIYLTQFEPITSEPETEVLHSLGALSSNVVSALKKLEASSKNMEASSKSNAQIIEAFQETSTAQMAVFIAKLNQIDTSRLQNDFNDLAAAMSNTTISVKNLAEMSNKTQFIVEEAKTKFDGLDDALETAKNNLLSAGDISSDINQLNQTVTESCKRITEVSEKVESQAIAATTEVSASVVRVTQEVRKTEEEAKKLGAALNQTVTSVVDFLNKPRK